MVWFQFYQYVFIGTHTQRLEKRGETRKAAEREAKSRKTEERERAAVFCLLRTSTTSQGAQRGNKARDPRLGDCGGAALRSCGEATPRSPSHLAHPPPSLPQPSHALPLTSGPSRQGERQQAQPGSAHDPGHGGSGHLRARRSQAHSHASLPTRRQRVWNPLLAQRLPARLPAIGCDAPPSAPQGSATGWRRGQDRPPGGGGRDRQGRSRRDPWGASLAQVTRTRGPAKGQGFTHGGRGLGRVLDRASKS